VAAEYEVNIKINTQKVETDLNTIDRKIKNLGKSTTSKEKSLERIVDKRARLMNRINEMEAKGLKVSKLRAQMGKATEQQSRRDLANAQKEYRILERSIRLEQSKLKILRSQREGFAASPIRGIRSMMGSPAQIAASGRQAADPIRGRADLVGSPAYYEAQQKAIDRLARQGGPSDPVKGHANLVGSPKYFEEQQKAIDKAARQGGARSPLRGSKSLPGSPAYFEHLNQEISKLARQGGARSPIRGNKDLIGSPAYYEHQRKELERLARKGGPSSPIRGGANMPGSPLALQRGMNRLGQVGLGAGFPLLFGGGPGSVLGGAAGGLTGSFGAQIALSAAGQQIDQLIGRTITSAESLGSVGTALDFLRERSLFSSKESEQLARKLENQGDLTGIAALVTEELNEALGPGGIQKMQDLAEQTRLAKEQWGQLTTNLELLIAGPLAEFLKIVNATLGIKVAQSQFARSLETLKTKDPERLKGLLPSFEGAKDPTKAIASNLAFGPNMAGGIFNMQGLSEGALISFTEQMNSIIKGMGTPDGTIPITEEDRKRFKPRAGVDKAAREKERLQKRLAKLEEERQKIIEISRFKDQIAAAEALGDTQLVIRLQGEQKMAEIEASRKAALIGVTNQREIEAINIVKATEKLAAQRETERQITEEQRRRQELFDDTVADLEYQLKISQATSEAERERLRIEKKLQELRKDGMKESQVAQIGQLMEQIAAENSPLNKFIKQSIESLNDLETQAVQVSQGIGNAIGNSLVNGLQNLISGAATVKDVFADMLKSVADVLLKQAAQMIATYIAIGVARAFAGLGGGESAGDGLNLTAVEQYSGVGANTPVSPLSEGGYVSGPTRALVGEGGEPEYVIPQSKMRESIARYSRGARGSAVIPDSGVSGTSGEGGGTAVAAPIDVRFSVERINNVDYVTADQFQAGMQRAAQQGAAQGEQRTLRRLKMSPSSRRGVGF
jgi:general stress protein YciG